MSHHAPLPPAGAPVPDPYAATAGRRPEGPEDAPWPGAGAVPGGPMAPRPAPAGRAGTAIAAFVLGLVATLACLVPLVNVLSVLTGLLAVVLGTVALRRLRRGGSGKGFAIAGLVLGAVGLLVSAAMWLFILLTVQSLEDGDLDALVREITRAAEARGGDTASVASPAGAGPADAGAPGTEEIVLADVTCDGVGAQAVVVSRETADGDPMLLEVTESAVLEDHRSDYAEPTVGQESLVLSCLGTGTWDDGTETAVRTELFLDADGMLFVDFVGQ